MADKQATVEEVSKIDELEFAGQLRSLTGPTKALFFWAGVAYTVFHLAVLNFWPIDSILLRAIHLGCGAAIGFGLYAAASGRQMNHVPWYDWILITAALGTAVYFFVELEGLQFRAGAMFEPGDVICGVVGLIVVLEFTRRTAGMALVIICLIFGIYCFAGPWLPGVLYHKGFQPGFFFSYIYSDQGVLGTTLEVSSTFIIMFTAFAAFLSRSKAGDWFNDLSVAVVGWARGGPAKAAVVSGILFGSISGSSVANVVASGSVTIPMMRRVGYDRATAGAVEATSSTGGQITPPVMGAGAFIMAEVTGIPYGDIAFAAIIPCLLFYIACYAHCDLHAVRNGLRGLPRADLPLLGPLMAKSYLVVPLVVLVWAFMEGYSGFRAAGLGIIACVVVSWLSRESRMGPRAVLDALDLAARDCLQLVAVCGAAGIIVGVIALTGIGGRFSHLILTIAGQSQVLALFFTMIIVTILGMGMPTTAAYAIAAAVVAPGLTRMGIPPLTAHMFIFYYAVLSAITPPVAVASFAAAAMAQADPWKTSWIAVKLGLATFIVPFMFFSSSALLGQGEWLDVLHVFVTAALGVVLLATSTEGWLNGPVPMPLRAVLFVAALCLITPGGLTDVIGVGLGIAVFVYQRIQNGARPGDKVPSAVPG